MYLFSPHPSLFRHAFCSVTLFSSATTVGSSALICSPVTSFLFFALFLSRRIRFNVRLGIELLLELGLVGSAPKCASFPFCYI